MTGPRKLPQRSGCSGKPQCEQHRQRRVHGQEPAPSGRRPQYPCRQCGKRQHYRTTTVIIASTGATDRLLGALPSCLGEKAIELQQGRALGAVVNEVRLGHASLDGAARVPSLSQAS